MKNSKINGKSKGMGFYGAWAPVALIGLGLGLGIQGCLQEPAPARESETLSVAARGSGEAIKEIRTLDSLRTMKPTGNYRLMANITMSSTAPAFLPVGNVFEPFQGTFDGNGFTIYNLRINGTDGYYQGLFSSTNGAILKRVRLSNVNVKVGSVSGAIVGYMVNTLLTDSYVTGSVAGSPYSSSYGYAIGMAVGSATDRSEIYRCYATGSVTGVTTSIGGFVGEIFGYGGNTVKIQEIFTNVNVNPTKPDFASEVKAGGLVGSAQGTLIQDIYCVGNVKGWGPAGGVVGLLVNDDPSSYPSIFTQAVSLGRVTSNTIPDRAGVMGAMSGDRVSGSRCGSFYNRMNDAGTPISMSDIACNVGLLPSELQSAYGTPADPVRYYRPYIIGDFVDANFRAAHPGTQYCKLGSGSDGDWGFGTCPAPGVVTIWKANANNQYCTLARIPNPGIQPLQ